MFYADFILSEHRSLAKIWLAAHWEKRLNKSTVLGTNLVETIEEILKNKRVALRTSGNLLLGIVKIFSKQVVYLLSDCHNFVFFVGDQSHSIPKENHFQVVGINEESLSSVSADNSSRKVTKSSRQKRETFRSYVSRIEDITIPSQLDSQISNSNEFSQIEMMRDTNSTLNKSKEVPINLEDFSFENFELSDIKATHKNDNLDITGLDVSLPKLDTLSNDVDSVLNKYTLRSSNVSFDLTMNNIVQIDYSNSQIKSKKKRKRRVQVDRTNILSNKELHNYGFKKHALIDQNVENRGKENIPPSDYTPSITIGTGGACPLMARCLNIINSNEGRINFMDSGNTFSPNMENQDLDGRNYFENDNYEFHDTENLTYANESLSDYDRTLELFNKSLEKYDDEDNNYWSKSTSLLAQNIKKLLNKHKEAIVFQKYLKSDKNINRKSAATKFFSLLILNKEKVFNVSQRFSFGKIKITANLNTSNVLPLTPPSLSLNL